MAAEYSGEPEDTAKIGMRVMQNEEDQNTKTADNEGTMYVIQH